MKARIIVLGPPGAGKTLVATELRDMLELHGADVRFDCDPLLEYEERTAEQAAQDKLAVGQTEWTIVEDIVRNITEWDAVNGMLAERRGHPDVLAKWIIRYPEYGSALLGAWLAVHESTAKALATAAITRRFGVR